MSVTKEKTAVEWFVDELQKAEYIPKDSILMDYVIGLANEMFMKQIKRAFRRGDITEMNGIEKISSTQYYNETFKTK